MTNFLENKKFSGILEKGILICLILHIVQFIIFFILEVKGLTLFNIIISIPLFTILFFLNRKGHHIPAFILGYFEVLLHQVLAVIAIGWASGYQLLIIGLIPMFFFNARWSAFIKLANILFILTIIIFLFYWNQVYTPYYVISADLLKIFQIVNIAGVISITALISWFYQSGAFKAENLLIKTNEELLEKNNIITNQNEEIIVQRDTLAEQKKDITSSIVYASVIQKSLLTDLSFLNNYFEGYFVLNIPRDSVSGDFYWAGKSGNCIHIVAADCTGHGVPGALMSMLGLFFLNENINENNFCNPASAIDKLRTFIIKTMQQKGDVGERHEGMDIAFCSIDIQSNTLTYSGAFNPAIVIRKNGDIEELDADKMPVSFSHNMKPFKNISVKFEKGDSLYIFSDGYADQFGGNEKKGGKKFKYSRLKTLLQEIATQPIPEQEKLLFTVHEGWKGNFEQVDDILIIGLKY